ncbi:MAG: FkbM family methyltransferase [Cyanobacteria bacterium P01_G01_bin.54]
MKNTIRKIAKKFNILLANTSHIGIELENDLSRLIASEPLSIVFDVGANHGQSAIRFANAFKSAQIFSFEPVSSNFQILSSKCASNPKIELIKKGIGKETGRFTIGLADCPGQHSLLLSDLSNRRETIDVITIDDVIREYKLEKIDLLKIDVEGLEMEVLEGAESTLENNKIRFIYAECIFEPNSLSPHTLFPELCNYLKQFNFAFFALYHESFHLATGSAMGNALFVNKQMLPNKVSGKVVNIV